MTHTTLEGTSESSIRDEICMIGASLYACGYTVCTAGNISARLPDGWLVTATDACLGRRDPACPAKVDSEGSWVSGDKPSKTLALHRVIYDSHREAHGIVHTHSTHLVALSLVSGENGPGFWREDDVLPPLTPYYVMKVGHIPLIRYRRPGDPAVAAQVAALACEVRGVLLEPLGPVVWERSVSHASYALEELEETARLRLLCGERASPLTRTDPEAIEAAFGMKW